LFYSLFELVKHKKELNFTFSESLNLYEKDDSFILLFQKEQKNKKKTDGKELVPIFTVGIILLPLYKAHCLSHYLYSFWL